jgi:hypothetical protein
MKILLLRSTVFMQEEQRDYEEDYPGDYA